MEKSKWALCIGLLLWTMLCLIVHAQTPLTPCSLADIDRDDDGLIEICDLEALDAIRYQLDGSGYRSDATAAKITAGCSVAEGCIGYELVVDLDFNDDASYRHIENKNIWMHGDGWQPIGDFFNAYSAVFNGNNHTISNLRIHRDIDNVGLFARLHSAAEIDKLRLSNVDIRGDFGVGALVSFNEGKIRRSSIEGGTLVSEGSIVGALVGTNNGIISAGNARAHLVGTHKVGGLVGDNINSIVNSCASGEITAMGDDVGGLVGHNSGSISNSCARGVIESKADNVGGLVGHNNGVVTNSYAVSRVASETDNVGGLVGLNNGIISDVYALSHKREEHDVQGRYRVGGLVGHNKNSVVNGYASVGVVGVGYTGGLIGLNYIVGIAVESTATHSYWDLTTSRAIISDGGDFRTTVQLQSPTAPGDASGQVYYGWSTRNWDFGTELHYPALKYAGSTLDATQANVGCTRLPDVASSSSDDYVPPICGDLLSGQYTGLSDLVLTDGLTLMPTFDPKVFNYRVVVGDDVTQLRFIATTIDSDADISVVDGAGMSSYMESGTAFAVSSNPAADVNLITISRQYKISVIYPLRIRGVPTDHRVNEGERIRLEVSSMSDSDTHRRHYLWTQLSGTPLLSGLNTRLSVLEIKVPEDFVMAAVDSSDVVLQVRVNDGTASYLSQTTLTIVKLENGSSLMQLDAPIFIAQTFTLIAPELSVENLSADPDGIVGLDILGYRWQSKSPFASASWRDLEDAGNASYDIPISPHLADSMRYRVWVNYGDGQGYTDNRVVSAEFVLPILDIDRDDDGLIEIHYLEDFSAMRNQLDGSGYRASINVAEKITKGCPASKCIGYELARDLDFNRDDSYRDISNKSDWAEKGEWQYLSSATGNNPFTAIFDGNNRTISNLKMYSVGRSLASLFGHVRGKIMNLGLLNVDIRGREYVGGLAGYNEGIIANCYVSGKVTSVDAYDMHFSTGSMAGGLVGLNANFDNDNKAVIINSFAGVDVTGNSRYVGGLVGNNQAAIINSYAMGSVKGDNTGVGGLVGINAKSGTILNSYARGKLEGSDRLGGLVGYSRGKITHSFAAVTISGSALIGGLVGDSDSAAHVINSYWDSQISGIYYSAGGTSKTTAELHFLTADESTRQTDAYYNWSNDDWDFGTREQYPILRYAPIPVSVPRHTVCTTVTNSDSSLPICAAPLSDRRHGLDELILLTQGSVSMSPTLDSSVSHYELTISGGNNQLRLIPIAADRAAVINISARGHLIDNNIKSGTTSSMILLNSEEATVITIAVTGKAIDSYTFNTHYIPVADVDDDDDGLIEIRKLEDLNAIRYNLYGTAYKAGPNAIETAAGCPERGCKGYELITDLDFTNNTDYRNIKNKDLWTKGGGWQPIGNHEEPFQAIFRGNSRIIGGLTINSPEVDDVALFGVLGAAAEVDGVGLSDVDILGKLRAAGLVATNLFGTISNSYATGDITVVGGTDASVGGLVALNRGIVANSYAIGRITAKGTSVSAGGLVGWNLQDDLSSRSISSERSSSIINSYTFGKVKGGRYAGGLVGRNTSATISRSYAVADTITDDFQPQGLVGKNENGLISASYWDITFAVAVDTDIINSIAMGAIGLTTEALKTPTVASSTTTRAYFNWNDKDWDFGTSEQYPILKYNHTRCNNPIVHPCDTITSNQSDNRLQSLVLSEGVGLVPAFEPLVFSYDMYVSADIDFVRLTPTAYVPTFITIYKDATLMENIGSGATSAPISLDKKSMITIKVAVEDGPLFQYTIKVHHLDTIVHDIDEDDDGLIELSNLEELSEIRYQPDGSGYRSATTASKITIGCPTSGCRGYELQRHLDFEDIASYRNASHRDIAHKAAWTSGPGWQPIQNFNAIFKANNKTISNLKINRPDMSNVGLFSTIGARAVVDGVALLAVDIIGDDNVGSLVGNNSGVISNSYVIGNTIGSAYANNTGGLVGSNNGMLHNSYASASVSGNRSIGGLVGNNDGTINNSYASGSIIAVTEGGGLVGRNAGVVGYSYTIAAVSAGSNGALIGNNEHGSVEHSYWNIDVGAQQQSVVGTSATTVQLKSAIAPGQSADELYVNWSTNDWDFGTAQLYPLLKYKDQDCTEHSAAPTCDVLLSNQRFGLLALELSDGARLFPSIQPEVFHYDITLDANRNEFSVIATTANADDYIEIEVDERDSTRIASGVKSHPIGGHSMRIVVVAAGEEGELILYTFSIHRLSFVVTDIDSDDDGLIEINDLEALNAIRYQLDGSGYRESDSAPLITEGCPPRGCNGYELIRDLDFGDAASYRDAAAHQQLWTEDEGWPPIGGRHDFFGGVFEGNDNTISRLMINEPAADYVGLFGRVGESGTIADLGLLRMKLIANNKMGGLVGVNDGTISNSYAIGSIEGRGSKVGGIVGVHRTTAKIVNSYARVKVSGTYYIGGLVGLNVGCIGGCYAIGSIAGDYNIGGLVGGNSMGLVKNSYAVGSVSGMHRVGGFIGSNENRGRVVHNYAIGSVSGNTDIGGFIAVNSADSTLSANYWDTRTSGITTGIDGSSGFNTIALQTPTTPTAIVYSGWSRDIWDFGTAAQYPHLKYLSSTTATSVEDHLGCAIAAKPRNEVLLSGQFVGLVNLELTTKDFNLHPLFHRSISDYRLTVYSDTEHLRLIPVAYAGATNIRIRSDKLYDEIVASATTSSAIPLNATATTVITIDVQPLNDIAVRYVIAVDRLNFAATGYTVDSDGDGLIEINYLEDLHALRYQTDGSGYRASSTASKITSGCPLGGCNGYELLRDLDFNDDDSYRYAAAHKKIWSRGTGWQPIGSVHHPWVGVFNGNHKTISNLTINKSATDNVGLFGVVGARGRIMNIGLADATIVASNRVGILAAVVGGVIINSNALGSVKGGDKVGGLVGETLVTAALVNSYAAVDVVATDGVGGLIGFNRGRIGACYAVGDVEARGSDVGGLVGNNFGGSITDSYAVGDVKGVNHVGAFIGSHHKRGGGVAYSYAIGMVQGSGLRIGGFGGINNNGTFIANYWNKETAGITSNIVGSDGFTTAAMQSPTMPTDTIYVGWRTDNWDFGTSTQYPSLKYIDGADIADLFKDSPACGAAVNLPACSDVLSDQHNALADLNLLPHHFSLSPSFASSVYEYRSTVFAATEAVQIVATAYDKDADIRIITDSSIDTLVMDATTSSAIPLNTSRTTLLTIAVHKQNKKVALYTIKLIRLGFTVDGNRVDKDGDGLVDINYLEDLHAMRYQADGSGYRASSTATKITAGCPASECNGYELLRDLDFNDERSYRYPTVHKNAWNLNEGWLPIGTKQHPFIASFNGNNKTIANLKINRPDTDGVGLFGVVGHGGRIDGVGLSDIEIIGKDKVGGLVGIVYGAIVNSSMNGKVEGRRNVGGLVGNHNAAMVNSYAAADVIGEYYVGGLVGLNTGNITACYTSSDIVGKNDYIGGFVGGNIDGVIHDNYALGSIHGEDNVGGFAGSNEGRGTITHNYAAVRVTGFGTNIGGFAGMNTGVLFDGNYWDKQISGISTNPLSNIGLDSDALKSQSTGNTYIDWDNTAWHFEKGEYPHLKHVQGIAITNLPLNYTACDTSADFICGSLLFGQRIGLADLKITSPGLTLFPNFNNRILSYNITAYADTHSIELIPIAYAKNFVHYKDASIRITQGQNLDEMVTSAIATPPILLNTTVTTMINIEVQTKKDRTVRYSVEVEHLDFLTSGEKVDKDGNGLIEINYLEDLYAIRYQSDGSGYRSGSAASKITAGCPTGGCIGYELSRSLDFKDSTSYRNTTIAARFMLNSTGWSPIGSEANPFAALFEGRGHTISNLLINGPQLDDVALFSHTTAEARISDVELSMVDIVGRHRVGGLVAVHMGTIERSRVSGGIIGSREVGGIVGRNASAAKIATSFATATVKGNAEVGGLVGGNYGIVHGSYVDGRIIGDARNSSSERIGGLVGVNANRVINSFAINNIAAHRSVGGLVGVNGSERSVAVILNSYAINTVRGDATVGGLVGRNEHNAQIINSYADSAVYGGSHSVGGLVGLNAATINNAYASGSALGSKIVGGLVADNGGSITNSYANVAVAGNARIGGLVGVGDADLVLYSHWDTDVDGIVHSAGGSGFSTVQLQAPTVPSNIPSTPYYRWNSEDWHFGDVQQYPQLRYTADGMNVGVACGDAAALPKCKDLLLPYGLASLEILESAQWSTPFEFSHFDYRITVNRGQRRIRVIPTAYASDAMIAVQVNAQSPIYVYSGSASPPLPLQVDEATVITIETAAIAYKLSVVHVPSIDVIKDIDDDDDGLIEINYLEDLDAIRYQPDGTAYREGSAAQRVTTGCAVGGCRGYELVVDLDFNLDASYRDPLAHKARWTTQQGWQPIGALDSDAFNGLLKGNGYSIYNLMIDKSAFDYIALFGKIADNAEIDSVGLLNFDVKGHAQVGSLVASNEGGKIVNSYASGRVSAHIHGGGLVGRNNGAILNSYASGQVINSGDYAGGLVGENRGSIMNSYASGHVIGSHYGGTLIGLNSGVVSNSYARGGIQLDNNLLTSGLVGLDSGGDVSECYWDTETSGIALGMHGRGLDSVALKSPLAAGMTESDVYYGWQLADWDFGSPEHYPAVKYTNDQNTLLPHQRSGLRSLVLSDRATLFPPFDTHVFDYHIIVPVEMSYIRLQATAIASNARIHIESEGLGYEQATSATATIAVKQTSATYVVLTVQSEATDTVRYRFAVHRSPPIEISGITYRAVDEGQHIRLHADYRVNRGSLRYLWTQISGPPLLLEVETEQATLEFSVPSDAVAKAASYSEAVLRLHISIGDTTLTESISLIINKRDNGLIRQPIAAPILKNSELTIAPALASDPDGIDQPQTVTYRWQSLLPTRGAGWRDIDGATESTYRIPPRVADATRYRVLISYVDKQGYIHQDIDSKVYTAVDLDHDDDGLIELNDRAAVSAMRYVLDGSGYKADMNATTSTVGCPPRGCRGYELIKDLNLGGASLQTIGSESNPFVGLFKGNNHTISNFRMTTTGNAVGLFGVAASTAEIDGVGLISVYVEGRGYVGALVGINEGVVSNSYVEQSTVVGFQDGIGGLVGSNSSGNNLSAIVVNSYADVHVSVNLATDNLSRVGGLVGENINGAIIANSYAKGNVVGPCSVGGLVGYNGDGNSRISNSYAIGKVASFGRVAYCNMHNLKFAGGLVGYNDRAMIENSYAISRVSGSAADNLGGLIGGSDASVAVKNSYWDITINGMQTSVGGISKTTVQLQSATQSGSTTNTVYFGWSDDDWDFGTHLQYPSLKYGAIASACGVSKQHSCNLLLPGQTKTSGLTQLIMSEGATLVPPFNSETFAYRLVLGDTDAIEFILVLENLNGESSIAKNGVFIKTAVTGERLSIPIEQTTTTLITIDLVELGERPIRYELRVHRPSELTISTTVNGQVDEGMRVGIDGSGGSYADEVELSRYNWEQLSGPSLPLDAQAKVAKMLDFVVPEDLVAKTDMHSEVVLRLTVDDGVAAVSEHISIRIQKINNSNIATIAAPRFINALTVAAPEIDLTEDTDGVGAEADITYQWQEKTPSGWHDVAGKIHKTYSLEPNATDNTQYRVRLGYIDGQGYTYTTLSEVVTFSLNLDRDGDGLIEIANLEGLDAMRYALTGNGYRKDYNSDVITTGCPLSGCRGYELSVDLDFADNASYRQPQINKRIWFEQEGWAPIGDIFAPFNAVFNGNGYTISNLTIKSDNYDAGLFGVIGSAAEINNIGLLNVDISNGENVGGIAGADTGGTISHSYAFAAVTGRYAAGGLIGVRIGGIINNSYAIGQVASNKSAGGLVGNDFAGAINNSYAFGDVKGDIYAGGLIGFGSRSAISNSYTAAKVTSDNDTGGLIGFGVKVYPTEIINNYSNADNNTTVDDRYGIALTTAQLQTPTSPGTTSTDAYYNWNTADWDFGNELQYPIVKGKDNVSLPNQRIGLTHLSLASPAKLSPSFDSRTFNYDVSVAADAIWIKLLPVAAAAEIRINGIETDSGKPSHPIALHPTTATVITLSVSAEDASPVLYILNVNNHFPQATITLPPQAELSEGDQITLDVTSMDANDDRLTYRWSQNSGAYILARTQRLVGVIENQNDADLSFKIPENLLTATQDVGEVELNLTIEDGKASIHKKASLRIIKKNNGAIPKPSPPILRNLSYTVPTVNPLLSQDPDGGAYPNSIRYQWQKYESTRWVDITDESGTNYTPPSAEIDQRYRVVVGYTDYQGHRDSVASEGTVFSSFESLPTSIFVHIRILLEGLLVD